MNQFSTQKNPSFMSDTVDRVVAYCSQFVMNRYFIKLFDRHISKQGDSAGNLSIHFVKDSMLVFVGSGSRARIFKAPMRCHGVARPNRASFSGSVITQGDDEIHFWCVWTGELVPAFAAQCRYVIAKVFLVSEG